MIWVLYIGGYIFVGMLLVVLRSVFYGDDGADDAPIIIMVWPILVVVLPFVAAGFIAQGIADFVCRWRDKEWS